MLKTSAYTYSTYRGIGVQLQWLRRRDGNNSSVLGPFYQHGLTLIPLWISNQMLAKVWDEATYPFPNFNVEAVEVSEWISNFIPHFIMNVITYPCWWKGLLESWGWSAMRGLSILQHSILRQFLQTWWQVKYNSNVQTSLMKSQHWYRYWLGAIRQQAIICTNIDQVLQYHMT